MCKEQRFSESGAPIAPTRCKEFVLLQSDRDRLAGVMAGIGEQNARNAKELHWHNQRLIEVTRARDALREALKAVEWSGRHDAIGRAGFPMCRSLKESGKHKPSCVIGNAIKEVG